MRTSSSAFIAWLQTTDRAVSYVCGLFRGLMCLRFGLYCMLAVVCCPASFAMDWATQSTELVRHSTSFEIDNVVCTVFVVWRITA
jgi:hypothetical protein